MPVDLSLTPYSFDGSFDSALRVRLSELEERVALLRERGRLTTESIRRYYGEKRFEQVAESNAIEGSTLTVGETQIAVLKGITISGHDPAFSRDAIALDNALQKVMEIAQRFEPSKILTLHELHGLLLGERAGAGIFRNEPVSIRGSEHVPPTNWRDIILQMEAWEQWSLQNAEAPAPLRSSILHAWLTHIHPYIDGNGRLSRAIGNLELIRAGYPPVIIRRRIRERYIDALATSDIAGDVGDFFDLIFECLDNSLTGLEVVLRTTENYSPEIARVRKVQERKYQIWQNAVRLLASVAEFELTEQLQSVGGAAYFKFFESTIDLDTFVSLTSSDENSRGGGWAFIVGLRIPGLSEFERLLWVGRRSRAMENAFANHNSPSLFWSRRNFRGYPKWERMTTDSPHAVELSADLTEGGDWKVIRSSGDYTTERTTFVAKRIARALITQAGSYVD